MDLLFSSNLGQGEIQSELKKYVNALESGYMQRIRDIRTKYNWDWVEWVKWEALWVNTMSQKSEME